MKLPEINRDLLPLKTVLFCLYGANACLVPYMSLHMKSLGISIEETAIIYTFLPFTQIMGSPLAGAIADKMGRYKPVLVISLLLSVAFSTGIMFVPPVSTGHERIPDSFVTCNTFNSPELVVESCNGVCDRTHTNNTYRILLSHCTPQSCYNTSEINSCGNLTGLPCYNLLQSVIEFSLQEPELEHQLCHYPLYIKDDDNFCKAENIMADITSNCSWKCNVKFLTNGSMEETIFGDKCSYNTENKQLTVWIYFFLRITFHIFLAIGITLMDATTLTMVESHGGQYGRQRFWAILSTAVFSPITGVLIDVLTTTNGRPDYSPAFYFFNGLTIITAVAVGLLKMEVAPPEENILKNAAKLFRLPVVVVLLFIIFWLGTVWGFIESFLFWYLEDLNSPKYLLGLTLTTGAITGLPFLHESEWFVRKVGQVNLLILALFVYFIRCFGYSFIYNPWYCIPFEAMEAFTYHLMWVAAATYSASLCPRSLLATMQGCVGGIHYGVGRGSGSLIGGNIMSLYGARIAFRAMGIISGGFCIVYAFLHYCIIKRFSKTEEKLKKAIELELSIGEDIPPEEDPLSGPDGVDDELKRYLAHARKSIESRGPVM